MGKSNGFDAMEKGKKKKKRDARRESSEGTDRETKSKKEDNNCEKKQITTWHVFIGWRKSNVLCQFQTEFKFKEKREHTNIDKIKNKNKKISRNEL